MIQRLRNRIARSEAEGGFTLIELLVVIIIIGILLAVAVPSYLQFRERAQKSAAQSNVRAAIPAVEAYYSDCGNYNFNMDPQSANCATAVGSALAALKKIDAGIASTVKAAAVSGGTMYCLSDKQGSYVAKVTGPQGAAGSSALSVNTTNTEC
jgi:type IV pilus assembly protein PilA